MKKIILSICLLFLVIVGAIRIYLVNTATFIDLFPKREYYSKNQEVALENGHYYFANYDWEGYYVEVIGTNIVNTDEFLKEHDAPENFLENMSLRDDLHHKNKDLLIVHTVFYFDGENSREQAPINLAEFKLVGPDYQIDAVPDLNKLSGFNEMLQGGSQFVITSGKRITVDMAYFINSGFESGLTTDYVLETGGIITTYYPIERIITLK